jgi:hypothetical protein
MTEDERRQLAELFREDDRLRAEHEQWMARREAKAASPVRESDPAALVYRTNENGAPAGASVTDTAPSDDDLVQLFDDPELNRRFTHTMGYVIAELRHEWRSEVASCRRNLAVCRRDLVKLREQIDSDTQNGVEVYCHSIERRLALLEGENIELKSLLGATLRRLGHTGDAKLGNADVVDLPNWRRGAAR